MLDSSSLNRPIQKIAIIGAGISGLSLAYRLQTLCCRGRVNTEIHLFEKNENPGGVIQTQVHDGFILEKGPDGFVQPKASLQEMVKELGIEEEMIGTMAQNRRSLILQNNNLFDVPDGFYLMSPAKILPFLKSPLLSWQGKIRTLCEVFVRKKQNNIDESLADFVRRRFGTENLDKISQAMLGGIHAADPETLSMQAALPRFVEMEQEYGSITKGILATISKPKNVSGARYGLFATFKNGMSTLVDALAAKVKKVRLNSSLKSIRYDISNKNWELNIQGEKKNFDMVCFCISPFHVSNILQDLNQEELKQLRSLSYASSAVFNFGFQSSQIPHLPKAMGIVIPQREQKHFLACTFVTNKYQNRAPINHILIRTFSGGAVLENKLRIPVSELRDKILSELTSILHINGEPVLEEHALWPQNMPQYTLGHLERVAKIQQIISKFPNLYAVGNCYGGVGIPDLIEKSYQLGERIFSVILERKSCLSVTEVSDVIPNGIIEISPGIKNSTDDLQFRIK